MMATIPAAPTPAKGAAERGQAGSGKEAGGFGELLRVRDGDAPREDAPVEATDEEEPGPSWRHKGGIGGLELIGGGFRDDTEMEAEEEEAGLHAEEDLSAALLPEGLAEAAQPETAAKEMEETGKRTDMAAATAGMERAGRRGREAPGMIAGAETTPSPVSIREGREGQAPAGGGERPVPAERAERSDLPLRTERREASLARGPQADRGPAAPAGDGLAGRVSVLSAQSVATPPVSMTTTALISVLGADRQMASLAQAAQLPAATRPEIPTTLHTLNIQLHPAELGMVTARLTASGQQLAVELHVERPEALQRLNGDSEAIVKALRGMGFEIDRVTVQQSFPGQGAANAGAERDGGFARQDGQAQDAPGRDARNGSGRRDGEASDGHDGGGARGGHGDGGDGVYI